jgi:hypothetical protein
MCCVRPSDWPYLLFVTNEENVNEAFCIRYICFRHDRFADRSSCYTLTYPRQQAGGHQPVVLRAGHHCDRRLDRGYDDLLLFQRRFGLIKIL